MDGPEHMKAVTGNGAAWLAFLASYAEQLTPIVQFLAAFFAAGAGLVTWLYYRKKLKQLNGKAD